MELGKCIIAAPLLLVSILIASDLAVLEAPCNNHLD